MSAYPSSRNATTQTDAGRPWSSRVGIRALLISLLLPGVIALLVIDSYNDYQTLADITNDAYDSALLEPARVLESSIEFTPDGHLQVVTPLYAQVMLESRAGLRKYFRIEEIDPPLPSGQPPGEPGVALLGMPDIPRPPVWPRSDGQPMFYDGVYRSDPVRMVALVRDLYYHGTHRQVLILVGESTGKRIEAEDSARRKELLRDGRMLALVVLMLWWGVAWAMRPLAKLRNEIRARSADDLTPLDARRVPAEVAPLVEAVNHHIARYRHILEEQSRFLDDASHQLRTPLAIMLTQAQYALRERDPALMRDGLRGIVAQLGRTRRLTEQLLQLAHASQGAESPHRTLDLNEVAREVVLQYLPLAHEKQQDLGWSDVRGEGGGSGAEDESEMTGFAGAAGAAGAAGPARSQEPAAPVAASEVELHEAIANLVHNAVNYAPRGARITVAVVRTDTRVEVRVSDNGPGLNPAMRARAFARFDRAGVEAAGAPTSGSGLGLAIAQAYARRNGGDIVLADGEPNAHGGVGLCAILWIPLKAGSP